MTNPHNFLSRAAVGGACLIAAAALTTAQRGAAQQQPDPAHAVSTQWTGPQPELLESALAAVVAPQAAAGQHPADLLVPVHTAVADQGVGYGIWAAGPAYKMSFHDGATFVPMLGADYPHNQPWRWRTVSVRVGEVELVTQAPRLSYAGLHAEYALGGVVEAYDVRQDGVEQTFVLTQRPRTSGDLVVRGEVASMLHAAASAAAHQALSFRDDAGSELLVYGKATAVDAEGQRCAMTSALVDGQVTLRLSGEWLAAATFPVIVDPLLGPGAQITGNTREEVDVARATEFSSDAVWMSYSVFASAADLDVYVRRFNDDGSLSTLAYSDVTASWSSRRSRCAYVAGADRSVTVFERYFPTLDESAVRYHVHDHSDNVSNTTYWGISTTDNAWRVDVGGTDFNTSGSQALVVWQQEPNAGGPFQNSGGSDVYAAVLDVTNTTYTAPFLVAGSSFVDAERPTVNQTASGSTGNFWLVGFQVISTLIIGGGSDDWDIGVRQIDQTGAMTTSYYIDNASSDHKLAPMIEGNGQNYVIAFTSSTQVQQPGKPAGSNGHQIRTVRLSWINDVGSEPFGTYLLQSNADARLELAGLGFDRDTDSHWALMFRSNVTDNLYLRTLGMRGHLLQSETVFSPAGGESTVRGGVSYDEVNDQFAIAYGVNGPSNYVVTDHFDYPYVTAAYASGTACSPGSISWVGSQQIGSRNSYVRSYNAANDSIHLMVMATAPVSALLVGIPPIQDGCWLLVPNVGADYLGILDLRVGSSIYWQLPLPEFLVNDTFYFQDFHTVGGGLFELVSTQRLTVPIVK